MAAWLIISLFVCTFTKVSVAAPVKDALEADEDYRKEYPEEFGNYFEGDMIVESGFRNAVINPAKLWPEGKVYYVIDENSNYTAKHVDHIKKAMESFAQNTCIRWIERTNQAGYVKIWNRKGCASNIGKNMENKQQHISLGNNCVLRVGTIIHEMMHTLGFYHEQTRPDRDDYVTVNFENIKQGKAGNFNKMSNEKIQTFGEPYDYLSVMHYGRRVFSVNQKDTITPKNDPNQKLGNRKGFTKIDIQKINKLYKCNM